MWGRRLKGTSVEIFSGESQAFSMIPEVQFNVCSKENQPHWDFVLHSSLNTRLTTTLSQWAECEVQRWNTCLASFKITWGESLHEGSFRSCWPVCVCSWSSVLITLTDMGRLSLEVDTAVLWGICPGLKNKGESELNASTFLSLLSVDVTGCF